MARNEAWVSVGWDHDTPAFLVASIRQWWRQMGCDAYPDATTLFITADAGGSNGYRSHAWKHELQQLADETGLSEVTGKTGARLNSGEACRRADTLQRRPQKRLKELKRDVQISPRPPVVLGGLLVVPQGLVGKMTGRPEPSVV